MVNRNGHGESDAFWGIMIIRMIRYQVSGRRGYPRSRCVSLPYLGFRGRWSKPQIVISRVLDCLLTMIQAIKWNIGATGCDYGRGTTLLVVITLSSGAGMGIIWWLCDQPPAHTEADIMTQEMTQMTRVIMARTQPSPDNGRTLTFTQILSPHRVGSSEYNVTELQWTSWAA